MAGQVSLVKKKKWSKTKNKNDILRMLQFYLTCVLFAWTFVFLSSTGRLHELLKQRIHSDVLLQWASSVVQESEIIRPWSVKTAEKESPGVLLEYLHRRNGNAKFRTELKGIWEINTKTEIKWAHISTEWLKKRSSYGNELKRSCRKLLLINQFKVRLGSVRNWNSWKKQHFTTLGYN